MLENSQTQVVPAATDKAPKNLRRQVATVVGATYYLCPTSVKC